MIDKKLLNYALKALLVFVSWYVLYHLLMQPQGFDSWMNKAVANGGHWLVGLFGYNTCLEGTSICVNIISTVHINTGCNGFEIFSIFAGFIVIYDGKWWLKIIYIIGGVVLLYACNVVRVAMLAIDHYENLKMFRFNHKYTYLIIMYAIVVGLWLFWITKVSKKT
jgi:exosortase/archaeosortase family protein